MPYFCLKKQTTNQIIHAGYFKSFKDCLENAVTEKIDLTNINLSGENLGNANLDGAIMPHANFSNANLSGTNMSEANLKHAKFHNAQLYNTCLCESDLTSADLRYASFGATLITNATIDATLFSTLSCFDLDFLSVASMRGCAFEDSEGQTHIMSTQPIILKGILKTPIIILDQSVKIGLKAFPKTILPGLIKLIPNLETDISKSAEQTKLLY